MWVRCVNAFAFLTMLGNTILVCSYDSFDFSYSFIVPGCPHSRNTRQKSPEQFRSATDCVLDHCFLAESGSYYSYRPFHESKKYIA